MQSGSTPPGKAIIEWILVIIGVILLIRLVFFLFKQVLDFDPGNIMQRFADMGLVGWVIQILIIAVVAGLFILSKYSDTNKK